MFRLINPNRVSTKVLTPSETEKLRLVTPCPYERYGESSDASAAPVEPL